MAGNPDRYSVDPGELDAVIGDLETCQQRLQTTTDHLEAQIAKLHASWEGLAAAAQREAHQEWEAGMAVMQGALEGLRRAARVAHTNYTHAVTANVSMWQELA